MFNLHIKETEISQTQSKGSESKTERYITLLFYACVLSNETNLIFEFSSRLSESIAHGL